MQSSSSSEFGSQRDLNQQAPKHGGRDFGRGDLSEGWTTEEEARWGTQLRECVKEATRDRVRARLRGRCEADVGAAHSDVVTRLLRQGDRLADDADPAWIAGGTVNRVCIDRYRRESRRPQVSLDAGPDEGGPREFEGQSSATDEDAALREVAGRIYAKLADRLDDAHLEVFWRSSIDGLSIPDAMAEVDALRSAKPNTVQRTLRRAVLAVKEQMIDAFAD